MSGCVVTEVLLSGCVNLNKTTKYDSMNESLDNLFINLPNYINFYERKEIKINRSTTNITIKELTIIQKENGNLYIKGFDKVISPGIPVVVCNDSLKYVYCFYYDGDILKIEIINRAIETELKNIGDKIINQTNNSFNKYNISVNLDDNINFLFSLINSSKTWELIFNLSIKGISIFFVDRNEGKKNILLEPNKIGKVTLSGIIIEKISPFIVKIKI